jgi:hypothetical protein
MSRIYHTSRTSYLVQLLDRCWDFSPNPKSRILYNSLLGGVIVSRCISSNLSALFLGRKSGGCHLARINSGVVNVLDRYVDRFLRKMNSKQLFFQYGREDVRDIVVGTIQQSLVRDARLCMWFHSSRRAVCFEREGQRCDIVVSVSVCSNYEVYMYCHRLFSCSLVHQMRIKYWGRREKESYNYVSIHSFRWGSRLALFEDRASFYLDEDGFVMVPWLSVFIFSGGKDVRALVSTYHSSFGNVSRFLEVFTTFWENWSTKGRCKVEASLDFSTAEGMNCIRFPEVSKRDTSFFLMTDELDIIPLYIREIKIMSSSEVSRLSTIRSLLTLDLL